MKSLRLKRWLRFVACYWLFMSVIFYLEFRYMDSDWAGLPGMLFSLPLSAPVAGLYLLAALAAARFGIDLHISDYHLEFAYIACAIANAFLWYQLYKWRLKRREQLRLEPPPPDTSFQHAPLEQKSRGR